MKITKWGPLKLERLLKIYGGNHIISEFKEKNLRIFKANYDSSNYKRTKLLFNISIMKNFADHIDSAHGYHEAIVLFGSASRGEDVERSDVDICIVGKERDLETQKFEQLMSRKINLLFIENIQKLKRDNPQLLNNLINGIVLKGYLKVF
jgi:predicted nucleotidyltransferase